MFAPLEGIIARRVLLNYRADRAVLQRWIPEPFQLVVQNGYAVVGVCVIRFEHLRPMGLPAALGMSSENMAHRVAIHYPTPEGVREGVYILRRETDRALIAYLGGRAFPGVHRLAAFEVDEGNNTLAVNIRTRDRQADVSFVSEYPARWEKTALFQEMGDASRFFARGDCGFSCGRHRDRLEGMRLRPLSWDMTPLAVLRLHAAFFEDQERFPRGSVEFDCALLMRGILHEWHPLSRVPGLGLVAGG